MPGVCAGATFMFSVNRRAGVCRHPNHASGSQVAARIMRGLLSGGGDGVDIVLLAKAAVMGIVEGLTEFLPISSTGHLILAGDLLGFSDAKAKVFDIAIQSGAMLAVILVYWQRLRDTVVSLGNSAQARAFVTNVAIAFAPAVLLGLVLGKAIKAHLFNAPVVATSFIAGGLIILWAERRPASVVRIDSVDAMSPWDALKVGLA